MNWSKTKNIIIVVLLITDILLCYMYVTNTVDGKEEERMDRLNKYLESQEVYLKTALPESADQKPLLFVACLDINPVFYRDGQIDKKSKIKNREDAKNQSEQIIRQMKIRKEFYKLDKIKYLGKDNYDVIYKSYYLDIPLEKSEMVFKIRDGFINKVNCMLLEPIKEGEVSNKTINASTATIRFIEEQRNSGVQGKIIINKIREVYWLNEEGRQPGEIRPLEDTLVPAWEITYNGGKKKYIEAYVVRN